MRTPQLLTLSITTIFLASCNMMPPLVQTTQNDGQKQLSAKSTQRESDIATPVSYSRAKTVANTNTGNTSSSATQKTVTFPNMVKTTEINEPVPAEIQEVETILKEEGINIDDLDNLDDGGFSTQTFNQRRLFLAQFKTGNRRMRSYQVKIPTTGQFELRLKEGNRYKILDNDATDGTAVIQMPAATLKTFIHLNRNWRSDSELKVEDPLYYLSDTLSSARKQWFSRTRWLSMGLRPLPVPSEWGSPHGNDFVLNMTSTNVSAFSMVWLQKNAEPAPPPFGTKEIGPEGGTVELPGVGKLEIPAGALSQNVTVRLSQKREHPRIVEYKDRLSGESYYYDYLGPIIKIEPMGLTLNKEANLYLNFNQSDIDRLGNNDPGVIKWAYFSENASPGIIGGFLEPLSSNDTVYSPRKIKAFSHVSRLISGDISPEDGLQKFSSVSEGFSTSQFTRPCPHAKELFFIDFVPSSFPVEQLLKSLNAVNKHYCDNFAVRPKQWFKGGVPILIRKKFSRPFVSPRPLVEHEQRELILAKQEGRKPVIPFGEVAIRLSANINETSNADLAHELHHVYQFQKIAEGRSYPEEYRSIIEGLAVYASGELLMTKGVPPVFNEPDKIVPSDDRAGYGSSIINSMRQSYFPVFRGEFQERFIQGSKEFGLPQAGLVYQSAAFIGVATNTIKEKQGLNLTYVLSNDLLKYTDLIIDNKLSLIDFLNMSLENINFKEEYANQVKNFLERNTTNQNFLKKLNGAPISLSDIYHEYSKEMIRKTNFLPDVDFDVKKDFLKIESKSDSTNFFDKINSNSDFLEPDVFPVSPNNSKKNYSSKLIDATIGCLSTAFYKVPEEQLKNSGRIIAKFKSRTPRNSDLKGFLISMKKAEQGKLSTVLTEQEIPPISNQSVTSDTRADFAYIVISNGKSDCRGELSTYQFLSTDESGNDKVLNILDPLSYLRTPQTKAEILVSSSINMKSSRASLEDSSNMVLESESSIETKCKIDGEEQCTVLVQSRDGKFIQSNIVEISDKLSSDGKSVSQDITIKVPNHALIGGASYVFKRNGLESNVLNDSVYVCNMLPKNASFQTASSKEKLRSCLVNRN